MDSTSALGQRIYEMLMESQYWPPQQMLAYQRSQLSQLLRHAKATVPFYKTRLDVVFKRNGDIDWDRWHEIPIVTRAELRDNYSAMITTALPPGHGPAKTYRSSGSSGIPVAVETTAIQSRVNWAATLRFLDVQKMDQSKTRAWISSVNRRNEPFQEEYQVGGWGKPWESSKKNGQNFVINRNLPETRKLELLRSLGVSYLQEVTNNAELTANANLALDNPVQLENISCISQRVTKEQRDLFRRSFGARTLSIYSSKESGHMGSQCGDSSNMHVNHEIILIEIVNGDDQLCLPGETGRVIVTPFFGTALPLIRYDQGDVAELHPACDCGSTLPILKNIEGRQDQLFRFPDGPRAMGVLFHRLLSEKLEVLALQLAQTGPLKIEIRYIPRNTGKKIDVAPIVEQFHQLVHPGLEVVLKPVDKIPLNSGGKLQSIVCEID